MGKKDSVRTFSCVFSLRKSIQLCQKTPFARIFMQVKSISSQKHLYIKYFQHNTLHIRLLYIRSKLRVTLWCSLRSQETRKFKWQREVVPESNFLFYDIFFIKNWSKITRYLLNRCCHLNTTGLLTEIKMQWRQGRYLLTAQHAAKQ